jgi:hypothetical protein
MTQDREHEQALQVTADSLMTEQHALQKRLQQLTLEYQSEADTVQQLQKGTASRVEVHMPSPDSPRTTNSMLIRRCRTQTSLWWAARGSSMWLVVPAACRCGCYAG